MSYKNNSDTEYACLLIASRLRLKLSNVNKKLLIRIESSKVCKEGKDKPAKHVILKTEGLAEGDKGGRKG